MKAITDKFMKNSKKDIWIIISAIFITHLQKLTASVNINQELKQPWKTKP